MKLSKKSSLLSNLQFVLEAHIINWPWPSHAEHSRRRRAARGRYLRRFLQPLTDEFRNIEPDLHPAEPEPERIFTIWLQGEQDMPPVVKGCIESMRRNTGKEVVVLDAESVFRWIDLPRFIVDMWKNGHMRAAHFTDICRVALVYRHGGYWFDATALATGQIPHWIENADVFLYETRTDPVTFHIGFQNCFIRSQKGNFLMKAWLHAIITYWQNVGYPKAYMIHQVILDFIIENDPRCKAIYDNMPHAEQQPTHQLWWAYGLEPFNEQKWEQIANLAPFQKTRHSDNPFEVAGSFRDVIMRRLLSLPAEPATDSSSQKPQPDIK